MGWLQRFREFWSGKSQAKREGVFRFVVAGVTREIDPLRVWFRLRDEEGFDWEGDPAAADAGDKEALRRVIQAARKAFALADFDAGGPTDAEAVDVLVDFTAWVLSQKKTPNGSPTTSPTSDTSLGPLPPANESALPSGMNGCGYAVPQFID